MPKMASANASDTILYYMKIPLQLYKNFIEIAASSPLRYHNVHYL